MKKLIGLLIITFSFSLNAQESEKLVKKADSRVAGYYLDTEANLSKLWEAKELIDQAISDPAIGQQFRTWSVNGKVYNAICSYESDSILIAQQYGASYSLKHPNAALTAYNSWLRAIDHATKDREKEEALAALTETSRYLNNYGLKTYESNDNKAAYNHFVAVVNINSLVTKANMKSIFVKPEDLLEQKYLAAVCAINADMLSEAAPLLEELIANNYNKPYIYEGLFRYYLLSDEAKAEQVLEKGRKAFPSETSLLFTEINHFLKKGRLNELVDKLNLAIQQEPNNVSVHTTLGNVFDNLCQKAWDEDNMEKGNEYYTQAENNYLNALNIKADDFTSLYSLGALYYNKAALLSKEVNKLSADYSKDGTRKYNERKLEMESYFDKALPYFEKAELASPNDKNTLIALKEIYAKKSQFDKSNAYKAKLESLPE